MKMPNFLYFADLLGNLAELGALDESGEVLEQLRNQRKEIARSLLGGAISQEEADALRQVETLLEDDILAVL